MRTPEDQNEFQLARADMPPSRPPGTFLRLPGRTLFLTLAAAVLAAGGIIMLKDAEPGHSRFLPPCLLHAATGFHCPGCGSTRAVHALLNGRLAQALAYNPLLFGSFPLIALLALDAARRDVRGVLSYRQRRLLTLVALSSILLYFVLRNLPFEPFTALSPPL